MELTRILKNIGKPYMQGADVKEAQKYLTIAGFSCGGADGKFGPMSESATKAYQKAYGLLVDGKIGPITWAHMQRYEIKIEVPGICAWAKEQVGNIYIWGAQGQLATEALIIAMENNVYYRNQALALFRKGAAAGLKDIRMFDCSGLVMKYLIENGLFKYDTNANGIYNNACSAIERVDLKAGDLVFKKNLTTIYHVGIYNGDGSVTHAKGRAFGVVNEVINAEPWSKYGRLKKL